MGGGRDGWTRMSLKVYGKVVWEFGGFVFQGRSGRYTDSDADGRRNEFRHTI